MSVEERALYDVLKDDLIKLASRLRLVYTHALYASSLKPLLRVRQLTLKGVKINDSFFHEIKPLLTDERICSLDSSLKLIMDFGSLKIYVIKAALEVFEDNEIKDTRIVLRLVSAYSKKEALKEVTRVEYSLAEELIKRYKPRILLLDRSLTSLKDFRLRLNRLFNSAYENKCSIVGFSKSSNLMLEDGTPLIGYLVLRGKLLGLSSWYYHPIFPEDMYRDVLPARVIIAKLSPNEYHAFRTDIYSPWSEVEHIISKVASLQDPALPGYPYPLIRAHRDSKISLTECQVVRCLVKELCKACYVIPEVVSFRGINLEGRSYNMGRRNIGSI